MAATKAGAGAAGTTSADPRYDDLAARVERLESAYESMLSGKIAEISQEERDKITLSRQPNSYPEAVEYEAALERLNARKNGSDA